MLSPWLLLVVIGLEASADVTCSAPSMEQAGPALLEEQAWQPSPLCLGGIEPTRQDIGSFTLCIDHLLDIGECTALIAEAEAAGMFQRKAGSRDVLHFESEHLAAVAVKRLRPHPLNMLEGKMGSSKEGMNWRFTGLSTSWRLVRYTAPALALHMNALRFPAASSRPTTPCCSAFTLTIYLNDVSEAHGGYTNFSKESNLKMYVQALQPVAGSALVLAHDVVHDGAKLSAGAPPKYIMRSEILYCLAEPLQPEQPMAGGYFKDSSDDVCDFEYCGTEVQEGDYHLVWPTDAEMLHPLQHYPTVPGRLEGGDAASSF